MGRAGQGSVGLVTARQSRIVRSGEDVVARRHVGAACPGSRGKEDKARCVRSGVDRTDRLGSRGWAFLGTVGRGSVGRHGRHGKAGPGPASRG